VIAAVAAATRMVTQVPNFAMIAVGVIAVFALWSIVAMFSSPKGVDTSAAIGAFVGLLGYAGLIAGQFLPQPVGSSGS